MVIKNKHVSGDIKNHHLQSTKVSRFLIFKKSLLTNMTLLSFIVANLGKIKKKTKEFLIFFYYFFFFFAIRFFITFLRLSSAVYVFFAFLTWKAPPPCGFPR